MNLAQKILEMTQDAETQTIEWIFQAIDKCIETDDSKIYAEVKIRLDAQYGTVQSRDKIFATPYVKSQVIEELIGTHVYNAGTYFQQRGVRRNLRAEMVTDSVRKDYDAKRKSLQTKIQTLAGSNEIVSLSEVSVEFDSKLGCYATLDNDDRIQIYTIIAGGWNIQKFHFRGLAKRLQSK